MTSPIDKTKLIEILKTMYYTKLKSGDGYGIFEGVSGKYTYHIKTGHMPWLSAYDVLSISVETENMIIDISPNHHSGMDITFLIAYKYNTLEQELLLFSRNLRVGEFETISLTRLTNRADEDYINYRLAV